MTVYSLCRLPNGGMEAAKKFVSGLPNVERQQHDGSIHRYILRGDGRVTLYISLKTIDVREGTSYSLGELVKRIQEHARAAEVRKDGTFC